MRRTGKNDETERTTLIISIVILKMSITIKEAMNLKDCM